MPAKLQNVPAQTAQTTQTAQTAQKCAVERRSISQSVVLPPFLACVKMNRHMFKMCRHKRHKRRKQHKQNKKCAVDRRLISINRIAPFLPCFGFLPGKLPRDHFLFEQQSRQFGGFEFRWERRYIKKKWHRPLCRVSTWHITCY